MGPRALIDEWRITWGLYSSPEAMDFWKLITVSTMPISTRRFFARAIALLSGSSGLDLPKPSVVMISGAIPLSAR